MKSKSLETYMVPSDLTRCLLCVRQGGYGPLRFAMGTAASLRGIRNPR